MNATIDIVLSNTTITKYFKIFLQNTDVANFLLVFINVNLSKYMPYCDK